MLKISDLKCGTVLIPKTLNHNMCLIIFSVTISQDYVLDLDNYIDVACLIIKNGKIRFNKQRPTDLTAWNKLC